MLSKFLSYITHGFYSVSYSIRYFSDYVAKGLQIVKSLIISDCPEIFLLVQ